MIINYEKGVNYMTDIHED